jgi:hypothetical protein
MSAIGILIIIVAVFLLFNAYNLASVFQGNFKLNALGYDIDNPNTRRRSIGTNHPGNN